jgi:hypothetical protein
MNSPTFNVIAWLPGIGRRCGSVLARGRSGGRADESSDCNEMQNWMPELQLRWARRKWPLGLRGNSMHLNVSKWAKHLNLQPTLGCQAGEPSALKST